MADSRSFDSDTMFTLDLIKDNRLRRLEQSSSSSDNGTNIESKNKFKGRNKKKYTVSESVREQREKLRLIVKASYHFGKCPDSIAITGQLKVVTIYDVFRNIQTELDENNYSITEAFSYLDKKCNNIRTASNADISLVNVIRGYNIISAKALDPKAGQVKLKQIYKSLQIYTLQHKDYVASLLCFYFTMYCFDKHQPGKAYNYILCSKWYLQHASPSQWTALVLETEAIYYLYMAYINRHKFDQVYIHKATESLRLAREHCCGLTESNQYMRIYYLVQLIYIKLGILPQQVFNIMLHPYYGTPDRYIISCLVRNGCFVKKCDLKSNVAYAKLMLNQAQEECFMLSSDYRTSALFLLLLPQVYIHIKLAELACYSNNFQEAKNQVQLTLDLIEEWCSMHSDQKWAKYVYTNVSCILDDIIGRLPYLGYIPYDEDGNIISIGKYNPRNNNIKPHHPGNDLVQHSASEVTMVKWQNSRHKIRLSASMHRHLWTGNVFSRSSIISHYFK